MQPVSNTSTPFENVYDADDDDEDDGGTLMVVTRFLCSFYMRQTTRRNLNAVANHSVNKT